MQIKECCQKYFDSTTVCSTQFLIIGSALAIIGGIGVYHSRKQAANSHIQNEIELFKQKTIDIKDIQQALKNFSLPKIEEIVFQRIFSFRSNRPLIIPIFRYLPREIEFKFPPPPDFKKIGSIDFINHGMPRKTFLAFSSVNKTVV